MSMYPKYALVPKYLSLVLSNFVQIKKTSICRGICMPMYMHAMVPNYLSPVLSNFVQIKNHLILKICTNGTKLFMSDLVKF